MHVHSCLREVVPEHSQWTELGLGMREVMAVNRKMRVTMVGYQQNNKCLADELQLTLRQTKKLFWNK